jgi:hypothetical protein
VSAVSLVRRIALPGFALPLLCGCASHERPFSAPTTSQPRAAHELRVMTFNLRVRTILDGLNIWNPDEYSLEMLTGKFPSLTANGCNLDQ